jgi:predicted N-acetyltransferase YhbS
MTTGSDTRIDVRLLRDADVEPVEEMSSIAMDAMDRKYGVSAPERNASRIRWAHQRIRHIAATDPEGSVVAERDGEIVGVGLAVCRGSLWFLSLLAVRGDLQGTGVGKRLIDATLDYGKECRLGMIGASPDPRALRRYSRAGFELYPAYSAEGVPDLREAPAGLGVREGDWDRDTELTETLVAQRRGAPYGPDLDFLRLPDTKLFVRDGPTPDDRAVCLLRRGTSTMVAAASDGAARRVLWAALAEAPDAVALPYVTGDQQWAIEIAMAARLTLKLGDTLCVKGMRAPAPYLATGVLG